MNKAIPLLFTLLVCMGASSIWAQGISPVTSATQAYTFTGSMTVHSGLNGNIYIDGKLICPITLGESKILEGIASGTREVELRSAKGSIKQTVTVYPDDIVDVRFIEDLSHKGMVYVDGGNFNMGDPTGTGHKDERPQHNVNISPFYIAKYEVSQKQFKDIMGYNTSWFIDPDRPVEMISWYEAVEFCNKLSESEGLEPAYSIHKNSKDPNNKQMEDNLKWEVEWDTKANGYRLPTEAEWEYAARGGAHTEGFKFSGSNDPLEYAWYFDKRRDLDWFEYHTTRIVGEMIPNELGLFDMSGNVYEWCWDWYGDYSVIQQNNPMGPLAGLGRVIRGGSYSSQISKVRVYQRGYEMPDCYYNVIGFRIARSCGE